MRFCLPAALFVLSFSTHASHTSEIFQLRPAFSSVGISLNDSLAVKSFYEPSLEFTNGTSTSIVGLFTVDSIGDLRETETPPTIDTFARKHALLFRLCSTLNIATTCKKLSPKVSHYTPAGISFTGAPQTVSMKMCLSSSGSICENHSVTTRPAMFFSTPTEGAVNAALQISNTAFSGRGQTTGLTAPVAITSSVTGRFAFVLGGAGPTGVQHILKCGVHPKTAQLINCAATAADLSSFTEVSDIALRPADDILFVIADGAPYSFAVDADNNILGVPSLFPNVGQPLSKVNSILLAPSGRGFLAILELDLTFSACLIDTRLNNMKCRKLTNTGPALVAPRKLAVLENADEHFFLLADGTTVKRCLTKVSQGTFSCDTTLIDFGVTVNSVTSPISFTNALASLTPFEAAAEYSFVASLDTPASSELGTLVSCTASSAAATTCRAAMPTALTTPARAAVAI